MIRRDIKPSRRLEVNIVLVDVQCKNCYTDFRVRLKAIVLSEHSVIRVYCPLCKTEHTLNLNVTLTFSKK